MSFSLFFSTPKKDEKENFDNNKKRNQKLTVIFFSTPFLSLHLPSPNQKTNKNSSTSQDLSDEFPQDYRNWASVLSQVLLKKEGSLGTAAKVLQRVMLATHGHLSKVANGEEFFPRFHLQDPVLSADAGAAIGGATSGLPPLPKVEGTMFASGATFFNYAPCVLSESYTGAQASLTGLNFAPTLLQVSRSGRRRREIKRKERARQRSGKKEEKLTTPKKNF